MCFVSHKKALSVSNSSVSAVSVDSFKSTMLPCGLSWDGAVRPVIEDVPCKKRAEDAMVSCPQSASLESKDRHDGKVSLPRWQS